MVGDDKKTARFQRGEHLPVHLGTIDRHIGHVVVGKEKRDQIEPADAGRYRIVEVSDDMDHIFHGGVLRADVEFVLHHPLDHRGRILRVDHAGGADAARQQFRAVAGVGLHIQHLHS